MKYIKTVVLLMMLPFYVQADYYINNDTTISGTWNVNQRLHINAKIHGTAVIENAALIIPDEYTQYFDVTITLVSCTTREFSAMWYGASPALTDNYTPLQQSINACINQMELFIPRGNYKFSTSLQVYTLYNNQYVGSALDMYGESGFWYNGTTLTYTGLSAYAIGYQFAKGGSLHNIMLHGQFVAPGNTGASYYSIALSAFNDASGRCMANYYSGIVIDYDGTKNTGGSTGLYIYDTWVDGFDVLYDVSPNGVTFNADNIVFDRIRCGQGRIGVRSGQAQEKGNQINHITAWDNLHTLIEIGNSGKYQAGNYAIDGGNIAGGVIRLFNISESGWFCSSVSNLYTESIGQVGTIYAGDSKNNMPTSINNCQFDFAYIAQAGVQTLLTSNSNYIKFTNCSFRYYGNYNDTLRFSGNATFENCNFSGHVTGGNDLFIDYSLGHYNIKKNQ